MATWLIVGGDGRGGVLVRTGIDLASEKTPQRLSTGATVQELQLINERLHFRRLTGTGPDEGWISTHLEHKVLAERLNHYTPNQAAASRAGAKAQPVPAPVPQPAAPAAPPAPTPPKPDNGGVKLPARGLRQEDKPRESAGAPMAIGWSAKDEGTKQQEAPKKPEFKIEVGRRVKLFGLTTKTDLNGKAGTVKEQQTDGGRWTVELDIGVKHVCREECLEILVDQEMAKERAKQERKAFERMEEEKRKKQMQHQADQMEETAKRSGPPRFCETPASRLPGDMGYELKWMAWNEIWYTCNSQLAGTTEMSSRVNRSRQAQTDAERRDEHLKKVVESNCFSRATINALRKQASMAGEQAARGVKDKVWLWAARCQAMEAPPEVVLTLWTEYVIATRTAAVAIFFAVIEEPVKSSRFQEEFEQLWHPMVG